MNVGDEWATDQPNPDFVGLKGIENLIIITFPIIRFLAIIHTYAFFNPDK